MLAEMINNNNNTLSDHLDIKHTSLKIKCLSVGTDCYQESQTIISEGFRCFNNL